jgi:hypothetical protein
MMAWRPPYQPQLPHTTWGSLVRRHCGHVLRGGADRFHALARRLRLLDFDVFFLGTAIGRTSVADGRPQASRLVRSTARPGSNAVVRVSPGSRIVGWG